MEAKPVEPAKAEAPEPAKQSEAAPHDPKPQVAQAPDSQTQIAAVPPAPTKVPAQVQESSKPKEDSHFKPAHDDFYADIFYFSGMGSLIGSALANGVYVPEKNQRNALDADEVDQAKTRQENAGGRGRGEIVVTARNQAQGLSTDFRQLQALLETLPTFTDATETKPYDRRAVDEPIHAHIYFSHEQKQQQQQQQQRGPAQTETRKGGGGTQQSSSAQEEQTTKFSFPASETASLSNETQTASDWSKSNRATSKPDQSNQYSYPVQDRVTASPYQYQHHQQGQPSTRDTAAQDRYGSRAGGGPGSGILDSIDQFDRSFRAAEAFNPSDLSFGSSVTAPHPPNRSIRQETEPTATVRQYVNPADHGIARPPVHQGRPTSSPRPYADQRGGGSVDSTGIKPWQLSHLRPLEAKGYNIVAEQERSFSHGSPRYGSDTHRGTPGTWSPYQQQQKQQEVPVVSVTARQTGAINHPYAATLEMPYCDL